MLILSTTLNIINYILSDRYQYVSIDSIKSNLIQAPPCSVLQGSKLSSLLYCIYCNEIPLLYKLVNSQYFNILTGEQPNLPINDLVHKIIQYVDDSSNIISTSNINGLQYYINDYFKVLEAYYNINKLLINPDKSKD